MYFPSNESLKLRSIAIPNGYELVDAQGRCVRFYRNECGEIFEFEREFTDWDIEIPTNVVEWTNGKITYERYKCNEVDVNHEVHPVFISGHGDEVSSVDVADAHGYGLPHPAAKVRFYFEHGPKQGYCKTELEFSSVEKALCFYREFWEPDLELYNPTVWRWVKNDWERIPGEEIWKCATED